MQISNSIVATYLIYESLTVLAAVTLGLYLKWELRVKISLLREWRWIAATLLLQPFGVLIFQLDPHRIRGDFFLHALSGGIMCLGLFYYLVQTFRQTFASWRLELAAFFMFVSTFGVLNELMEFAMDRLGLGAFSTDRLDTWRDLTANTVGSLVLWLVLRSVRRRSR